MAWVKLDDGFAEHEKVIDLSDKAFRVHVSALCFAARRRKGGRLKQGFCPDRKVARELVEAGVWDLHPDGGWIIHDWFDYNLTDEQRQELSQKRSKAGSKGAAKRWQVASKSMAVPVPQPTESTSSAPRSEVEQRADVLLADDATPTYFRMRLIERDPAWAKLDNGTLMNLGAKYGDSVVVEAMRRIMNGPADISGDRPHGLLTHMCKSVASQEAS